MKKSLREKSFGFVRVATATPRLEVADCIFNAREIAKIMREAKQEAVQVLFFPELSITGYTCQDLFQQASLLEGAIAGLDIVLTASEADFPGLVAVGMPLVVDDQLFNCAVVISRGRILGIVPKTCMPNYKEFYEERWFASAANARSKTIQLLDQEVPFGTDILFEADNFPGLVIGVEICEDLWMPVPPSSYQAVNGATIIGNLSASNEIIGKAAYRRELVSNQSARCIAAYAYASCGVHESSTDLVFGGHRLIAENGRTLLDSDRFERDSTFDVADIDLDIIRIDRLRTNSFGDSLLYMGLERSYRRIKFKVEPAKKIKKLKRRIDAHPFVPDDSALLSERLEEIFSIQVAALAKRLEHVGNYRLTEGISGGLDSTLALLVACKTMDKLGVSRQNIQGYTMPGFGTTDRTKNNALGLMEELGITAMEVADIRAACLEQMRLMKHKPFGIDIEALYEEEGSSDSGRTLKEVQAAVVERFTAMLKDLPPGSQDLKFENTQARMRTSILMNSGFVLGTGDLSELAIGWCTYNGDHMSMYGVNVGIPKTLVKFLVKWAAENQFEGKARELMLDIVDTVISPELLPVSEDGEISQKTEGVIGPYELHDFFLFHMLRYGSSPEKILYLANQTQFDVEYSHEEIQIWLRTFISRFFNNQFKRSCLPDGPKVGSISLSPRGDWRMPSDAEATMWLQWAERIAQNSDQSNGGSNGAAATTDRKILAKKTTPTSKVLRVLLRVDAAQNDFRPGGALAVGGGDEIMDVLNELSSSEYYDLVVDSQDEHDEDHGSFAEQHDGVEEYSVGELFGIEQRFWPKHCVNGTWGWKFHPDFDQTNTDRIFPKGKDSRVDSYSAFYDNGRDASDELKAKYPFLGQSTGLAEYLCEEAEKRGCDEIQVDVVGLALGFCVSWSAVDARNETYRGKQYTVRLIEDGTRAIVFEEGDYERYIQDLESIGIEVIQSEAVPMEAPAH